MIRSVLLCAALAVAPVAAQAAPVAVYDAVGDFGAPVFSYGSGTTGSNFTALPLFTPDFCFGVANLACYQPAPGTHPVIAMKTVSAYNSGGVSIPLDTLYLHPANGGPDTDAILRFTAPVASKYRLTGYFQRQDLTNNGNGVNASIYHGAMPMFATLLDRDVPGPTAFAAAPIEIFLNAGETLDFGVNNNGEYTYDSTGLSASIAQVPEPAGWALMIGGFGLVGGAFRSRRRLAFA